MRIPFDVEETFGKKRVPVQATIEGEPYRGTLVRMGEPYHILIVLKAIREKIGMTFGNEVVVTLEADTEPRLVEVPPDFQQALDHAPIAKAAFQKLSYTHQKEYLSAILDAKYEFTRHDRIAKAIKMLKQDKKGQ